MRNSSESQSCIICYLSYNFMRPLLSSRERMVIALTYKNKTHYYYNKNG
jgi:hypothetical protein